MSSALGIDKLDVDPYTITAALNAPLQNVTDVELSADLLHVNGFAFVGKCRVARDDERSGNARQVGRQAFGYAIDKIFLFRIAPNIGEWKDDYRQTRWHRRRACRRTRRFCLPVCPVLNNRIDP